MGTVAIHRRRCRSDVIHCVLNVGEGFRALMVEFALCLRGYRIRCRVGLRGRRLDERQCFLQGCQGLVEARVMSRYQTSAQPGAKPKRRCCGFGLRPTPPFPMLAQ